MSDEITDLNNARQDKRQKTGWSLEKIKERAVTDFKKNKKISKDNP